MEGFNSDFLKDMFSGKNKDPLALYKAFIKMATPEIADSILDKVDVIKYGGDLLHITIMNDKYEIIPNLLKKGASILSPPESVQGEDWYRKSPYIIQASKSGSTEMINTLIQNGANLEDVGFICHSKKKKNSVSSNFVGCAAYHGNL
jgi:hypothetical protein